MPSSTDRKVERWRMILRWLMVATFLYAGFLHVAHPRYFLPIVPEWVPLPYQVVIATGLCELAGAVGLAIPRLRWVAGVMLAIYAVCVFPANIKHALAHVVIGRHYALGWWYHGPRLLFQPVIVWWCLFAGSVVDWPFYRSKPN